MHPNDESVDHLHRSVMGGSEPLHDPVPDAALDAVDLPWIFEQSIPTRNVRLLWIET